MWLTYRHCLTGSGADDERENRNDSAAAVSHYTDFSCRFGGIVIRNKVQPPLLALRVAQETDVWQESSKVLLQEITGLDAELLGAATLFRVVLERTQQYGLNDPIDYLSLVRGDSRVRAEFVAATTVPETWFFRDETPFTYFEHWLEQRLRNFTSATPSCTVLSLPCASGEEAYSMAMVAHRVGFNSEMFRVLGIDINATLIAQAQVGIYGDNAFRGAGWQPYQECFDRVDDARSVKSFVREFVTFRCANLFTLNAEGAGRKFDVVFCRNLLIYMNPATQQKALHELSLLLADDGVLVVGHAEAGVLRSRGFLADSFAGGFAFRKLRHGAELARKKNQQPHMVSAPLKGNPPRKQSPSESSVIGSYTSLVAEIEQLADRGDLLAAQQRCEWVLSTGADDAEVLFLCGVIAQARGDSVAARQLLERAILRQPDHARALLQLSAVLHAAGDGARAEELGLRAQDVLREHKQAKNVDD